MEALASNYKSHEERKKKKMKQNKKKRRNKLVQAENHFIAFENTITFTLHYMHSMKIAAERTSVSGLVNEHCHG